MLLVEFAADVSRTMSWSRCDTDDSTFKDDSIQKRPPLGTKESPQTLARPGDSPGPNLAHHFPIGGDGSAYLTDLRPRDFHLH